MAARAMFVSTLDTAWREIEPVRLGPVPTGDGTPDRFVTVEASDGSQLRLDLYQASEETCCFEEICFWLEFVVIGWGHHIHLVDLQTKTVATIDLGGYFGSLHPVEQCLLVASDQCLFRIEPDGSVLWRSESLGIDGVTVSVVTEDVVRGSGEWEPPGGWRPYQVSLATGQPA